MDGQIFRTVKDETTQELKTAWTNDWISGFEPYSYLDAQEVGIPYLQDTTSAMLIRFLPDSMSVLKSISFVITQGAQKSCSVALYDQDRNLLAQSETMSMANAGAFTLELDSNVKVSPRYSYFIAIMTTGNGYQLLGKNINIGTNNVFPCCLQSQNNLAGGTFPAVFENSIAQGNTFVPYLQVNGLY